METVSIITINFASTDYKVVPITFHKDELELKRNKFGFNNDVVLYNGIFVFSNISYQTLMCLSKFYGTRWWPNKFLKCSLITDSHHFKNAEEIATFFEYEYNFDILEEGEVIEQTTLTDHTYLEHNNDFLNLFQTNSV